jgi:Domain of unknown function (DUF5102)
VRLWVPPLFNTDLPLSRSLYKTLFEEAAPSLRAPNWTRSRIRRNHLIALGIPVNLDEVNPQANGRALPTLNIITRPHSTPPRPGSKQVARSRPGSRQATPTQTAKTAGFSSAAQIAIQNLGPKPEIDNNKVSMLLDLDPGRFLSSFQLSLTYPSLQTTSLCSPSRSWKHTMLLFEHKLLLPHIYYRTFCRVVTPYNKIPMHSTRR